MCGYKKRVFDTWINIREIRAARQFQQNLTGRNYFLSDFEVIRDLEQYCFIIIRYFVEDELN